jgi:hypothetical protein
MLSIETNNSQILYVQPPGAYDESCKVVYVSYRRAGKYFRLGSLPLLFLQVYVCSRPLSFSIVGATLLYINVSVSSCLQNW